MANEVAFKWYAVEPPAGGNSLQDLGTAVSSGLALARAAIEEARVAAQAQALLNSSTEDLVVTAANTAVQLVIDTINTVLDKLLTGTGLYLLPIPPPKKGLYRFIADVADAGNVEENAVDFPVNNVMASATPAQQEMMRKSALLTQLLNPGDLFSGGNAYFVKTLTEAIFDPNDPNRPQFEPSSSWAYGLFVAGASDLTSIIELAGFLQNLIGGFIGANFVGPAAGIGNLVPRGVRVSPSAYGAAAVVEWDLVTVQQHLDSYDQATIQAVKYAIIRSTDLGARTATTVRDLFGTNRLSTGLRGNYGSEVLAIRRYDGIVTQYIDQDTLDPNQTYYYHVAFSTCIRPAQPGATQSLRSAFNRGETPDSQDRSDEPRDLGFNLVSSAVEYRKPRRREDHLISRSGKFPDWIRTPSVAGSFYAVTEFVDLIRQYLNKFKNTVGNLASQNSQLVEFFDREVLRYSRLATDIEQRLRQIESVFAVPSAGLYATFRYGTGTIGGFLADLTDAFENTQDTEKPPFNNGDEFVTGLVLLAIGPDPAPVLAAYEFLKLLFEGTDNSDPALAGIQSINTALAEVEAGLVARITGGTNAVSNPSNVFNEDMSPRPVGSGDSTCDP